MAPLAIRKTGENEGMGTVPVVHCKYHRNEIRHLITTAPSPCFWERSDLKDIPAITRRFHKEWWVLLGQRAGGSRLSFEHVIQSTSSCTATSAFLRVSWGERWIFTQPRGYMPGMARRRLGAGDPAERRPNSWLGEDCDRFPVKTGAGTASCSERSIMGTEIRRPSDSADWVWQKKRTAFSRLLVGRSPDAVPDPPPPHATYIGSYSRRGSRSNEQEADVTLCSLAGKLQEERTRRINFGCSTAKRGGGGRRE